MENLQVIEMKISSQYGKMIQQYQITDRFPPIHYYPNEYLVVVNNQKFKNPFLAKVLRTRIMGCYLCGDRVDCVHHIIPVIELGNNRSKNLIPLCTHHHQKMHNAFPVELPRPLGINTALIRKTKKLLRKFWTKNPSKLRLNQDQEFINLHLVIDDTIKYFIKHNRVDRLKEYTQELYNNGTIKHKPNY